MAVSGIIRRALLATSLMVLSLPTGSPREPVEPPATSAAMIRGLLDRFQYDQAHDRAGE